MTQKSIPSRVGESKLGDLLGARNCEENAAPAQQAAPKWPPAPTTFAGFAERLGCARLVPVVPPTAPISEKSTLLKRPGARGKAVGVNGPKGWHGFDWLNYECKPHDIERWQSMGAGIGIKTGLQPDGGCLVLLDADTLDEGHAQIIRDVIEKKLNQLPVRIGRHPKVGYVVRLSEPMPYSRIEFGEANEKGSLKDRVEVLSDGRQFVAHGIHPATGKPYHWPCGLPAFDGIPVVHPDQIREVLEALRFLLPNGKPLITEGSKSSAVVDQASLKGDIDRVREAVSLIPNRFEAREDYIGIGIAIKAALPDNPEDALDIFQDWAARWEGGENDPDVVEADFRRMKPPFRRGASYLYELAEQHSPDKFNRAEDWFEHLDEKPESPFDLQHRNNKEDEAPVTIDVVKPRKWVGVDVPARKWLVAGMIPDGEVTMLTGAGGVGKTLLAQQIATCCATGIKFFGRDTLRCKVMAFLCEDAEDELHLRQRDINASLCLSMEDVDENLYIAPRKYMDNLLAQFDRNSGTMKRTRIWTALRNYCVANGIKLLIVDTSADTFGGSEIDRSQVRQYVQACLGAIAKEIGGAVLLLAHPSKAGQSSGDGTSGSTAWHASVRSRLYLEHASKDGSGPFRRLTNKKANYGPAGDVFMLRWSRGAFELASEKSAAGAEGGEQGGAPKMADAVDDALLFALEQVNAVAKETGANAAVLSDATNSPYFAPKALQAAMPNDLGHFSRPELDAGWARLVAAGKVRKVIASRDTYRRPKWGFEIVEATDAPQLQSDIQNQASEAGNVFG